MRNNKSKIAFGVLGISLVLAGGIFIGRGFFKTNANSGLNVSENDKVNTFDLANNSANDMSDEELINKALSIIPGNIISKEYDYEMGRNLISFDIVDNNGIAREIELEVSTGKVYDIDYDYDNQGNRFINKSLFEVNKTFDECKEIALSKVNGVEVINYKEDADYGLFIYEFIVKSSDGNLYEVDVETKSGEVIKVEREDDYNPNSYNISKVIINSDTQSNIEVSQSDSSNTSTTLPESNVNTNQNTNQLTNNEDTLRQKVLSLYPGEVINYHKDYDDGVVEHKYTVKQSDGTVYKIEITESGYITDVDFEGKYVNGVFYDEDYYDYD